MAGRYCAEATAIQPGSADGRDWLVPPRRDGDKDHPVRSGDRRLHASDLRGRSQTNLLLDPHTRAPRTDEYSVGVDREIGRGLAVAFAYVRKDGANFIGWTDVAGQYREETRTLPDGRSLPVFALDTAVTPASARRFLLTNQDNYALTYNGLVMVLEKRRSRGWQAFGSYTLSKAARAPGCQRLDRRRRAGQLGRSTRFG